MPMPTPAPGENIQNLFETKLGQVTHMFCLNFPIFGAEEQKIQSIRSQDVVWFSQRSHNQNKAN